MVIKVYTNFCGLNVPEDGVKWNISQSFLSILVYEKYNLQIYLDSCNQKIVNKQKIDYLHGNIFKSDEHLVSWL